MKIYPNFKQTAKCYLCETNADKPCCLIAKEGEGNNLEAVLVHIECIPQLMLTKIGDKEVIYAGFSK